MKNRTIEKFQEEMSLEEMRCERLRNLINPLWVLPDILERFLKNDELYFDKEFILELIKSANDHKPMLRRLMEPNISKEEIQTLYL